MGLVSYLQTEECHEIKGAAQKLAIVRTGFFSGKYTLKFKGMFAQARRLP